jgi:hypothetical protein
MTLRSAALGAWAAAVLLALHAVTPLQLPLLVLTPIKFEVPNL